MTNGVAEVRVEFKTWQPVRFVRARDFARISIVDESGHADVREIDLDASNEFRRYVRDHVTNRPGVTITPGAGWTA